MKRARIVVAAVVLLCSVALHFDPPAWAASRPADHVYSQGGSFTSSGSGTSDHNFDHPSHITTDAIRHRMFVSDQYNNRVLVYNLTTHNTFVDDTADYVLGQGDFTSNAPSTTQNRMNSPTGLAYDPTRDRLFVAEGGSNRILVFNTSTITNGMNASYVLGQSDYITYTTPAPPTASSMSGPRQLDFDINTGRLFVADLFNSRVLVFDTTTITNGMSATYVLGQSGFTTGGGTTTQTGQSGTQGVSFDPTSKYLYVADSDNNRVLVYNLASIGTGMAASYVIGQTDYTSNSAAVTQSGMSKPTGVDAKSGTVYVGQESAQRVTGYVKSALANGMSASLVYGQPDYTSSGAAVSQIRMADTWSVYFDVWSYSLYVSDSNNNRVLEYDGLQNETTLSAVVDPSFSFSVGNASTACNSEPNFNGSAGASSSVALGHVAASASKSGGQTLTIASNAGGGFVVYVRGLSATGNLMSASHSWTDIAGTYPTGTTLGSGEAFGYTFHDSTAATSVSNPSASRYSALDNVGRAVMGSTSSGSGSGCVSYIVQSSASTPAGSYSANVIYSAVPTF